jgi:F0F1-type ATP synthase assembly protein I
VRHGEEIFEVIAVEPAEPPHPWRYRLAPWDDAFTVRTVLDLSDLGLDRYEADTRAEVDRRRRLGRLSVVLPLVGMLPVAHLQRLREDIGLSPARAVNVSALVLLVPCLPIAMYGILMYLAPELASFFGGSDGGGSIWIPPMPLVLAACYFSAESAVRLRAADPLGSAPVAMLVALLTAAGIVAPPPDPARDESARRHAIAARAHLVDRVFKLPAPGGSGTELRIESAAPKTWPPEAIIRHEDRFYLVSRSHTEERGGRPRHVYHLLEVDEDARARPFISYRPDDAMVERQRGAERVREDRQHIFLPLTGFLPGEVQERMRRESGFDAAEATRTSAWIEIVLAGLCALFAVGVLRSGSPSASEAAVALLCAAGFLSEGAVRLRRLDREGTPSGTLLLAWWPRR